MIEKKIIKKSSLEELFKKLKQDGKRIVAPREKKGIIIFDEVSSFSAVSGFASGKQEVAQDHVQTGLSPKEYVFPKVEEILSFQFEEKNIKVEEDIAKPVPTVLFGLRPCDARSFSSLKAVFTWDYQDVFFTSKIEETTIIGVSCTHSDEYCFCTSVGGGPGDTAGSDILLTPISGDVFLSEIITEKGKAVVSLAPELFSAAGGSASGGTEGMSEEKEKHIAHIPSYFDVKELADKLDAVFYDDIWVEQSLRCVGCGVCTFVCPVCSCFDIQDETDKDKGKRFRCWDSCGFSLFTLHTSGHNPREKQSQRWRQRIMHKFVYQPKRLNFLGCVGCGRCSRACPADMNILEHLRNIMEAV